MQWLLLAIYIPVPYLDDMHERRRRKYYTFFAEGVMFTDLRKPHTCVALLMLRVRAWLLSRVELCSVKVPPGLSWLWTECRWLMVPSKCIFRAYLLSGMVCTYRLIPSWWLIDSFKTATWLASTSPINRASSAHRGSLWQASAGKQTKVLST